MKNLGGGGKRCHTTVTPAIRNHQLKYVDRTHTTHQPSKTRRKTRDNDTLTQRGGGQQNSVDQKKAGRQAGRKDHTRRSHLCSAPSTRDTHSTRRATHKHTTHTYTHTSQTYKKPGGRPWPFIESDRLQLNLLRTAGQAVDLPCLVTITGRLRATATTACWVDHPPLLHPHRRGEEGQITTWGSITQCHVTYLLTVPSSSPLCTLASS